MAPSKFDTIKLTTKPKNKLRRKDDFLRKKKSKESTKRDDRFRRKREEEKNPHLAAERRAQNVPLTIDRKRVWDEVEFEEGDGIGLSVDVSQFKKQRVEDKPAGEATDGTGLTESNLKEVEKLTAAVEEDVAENGEEALDVEDEDSFEGLDDDENEGEDLDEDSEEDDLASILDEDDEEEDAAARKKTKDALSMPPPPRPKRATSPSASATSTNLSLIPDALASKFPQLFKPPEDPKILITTSLNGTVHDQATILTEFFPNSHYVPRTRHRWNSHQFSLREIAKFATNRQYTTLMVMTEDKKRPSGLTVIHLPEGPTFHFSISNWVEGKKLPGHGNPTEHYPELILNNFRTPLGILTAHSFRTMFPPQPELAGRQVVTLHNQRDYIFVRRHRYIFRDKRATEKVVVGADGKPIKGAEDIKAGLQELGPRFTLKLRRIDKGIQRGSGQEWEWKPSLEKQRTKFQL